MNEHVAIGFVRRHRHVLAAATGVVAVLCIFGLPWLVPSQHAAILSDALASGFNNRVAVLALIGAACAMFALGAVAFGEPAAQGRRVIGIGAAPEGERVSRRVLVVAMVATVALVAIQAWVMRDQPHGDSAYFIDRILRLSAGQRPFSEFEFSYGPLMLYAPWAIFRVLNAAFGTSAFFAYYVCVAAAYTAGLGLVAFTVNRLEMTRTQRHAALTVVAVMTLLHPVMGINYCALRFFAPLAAFIWGLERLQVDRGLSAGWLAAPAAVTAVLLFSPEMGVATMVATGFALASLVAVDRRRFLPPLTVLVGWSVALIWLLVSTSGGALGAFAAGSYYFPVLPGIPALLYVASALLAAWGIGAVLPGSEPFDRSVQMGWLALLAILVVPAFGRADFMHIFWNGAGVLLTASAVASRRWRVGFGYVMGVAAVFGVVLAAYTYNFSYPTLANATVAAFHSSESGARTLARLGVEPMEIAMGRHRAVLAERKRQLAEAAQLTKIPNMAFLAHLWGPVGPAVVSSGNLSPAYWSSWGPMREQEVVTLKAQLASATNLVIPADVYEASLSAAKGAEPRPSGAVVSVPGIASSSAWNAILQSCPVIIHGKNPVLDPTATWGVLLRDWRPYRYIGGYVWLVRR
ncbi:MAG TPA: hypothetical protein VFG89_03025 [Coriobacteriia bacterium]|nr:hypothetical protein [Coriobacteriia bacterium]